MNDGIIKNDGTSRLMRASLPATYEDFKRACAAGTQPLDVLFNASGWAQQPDFLNKGNLLADRTTARAGLFSTAVPDDLLYLLSRFNLNLGNEYIWHKKKSESTVTEDESQSSVTVSNNVGTTFFGTGYYIDKSTGLYTLTGRGSARGDETGKLAGKWVFSGGKQNTEQADTIFKLIEERSMSSRGNEWNATKRVATFSVKETDFGYVTSPDENAYPAAEPDVYLYEKLGKLGDAYFMETGSYIGKGKTGSKANANSIRFTRSPKIVFIFGGIGTNNVSFGAFFISQLTGAYQSYSYFLAMDQSANIDKFSYARYVNHTLSYYRDAYNSTAEQLNVYGVKYNYVALC